MKRDNFESIMLPDVQRGAVSDLPFLEENIECVQHEPMPEDSKGVGDTRM